MNASDGTMPRRLLHVVRSLRAETGGVATAVRQLTTALQARGHAVAIASLDPADAGQPDLSVVGRSSAGYGYAGDFVPWLRERRQDFDAVLVHGLWQYPGLGTWRALHGTSTPYLVYCHGMLDPWFKRTYPLKHAKKWLYWPWAEYRVLRDAARVLFTCEEERRLARQSFWLYRAKEEVVPLGLPEPPVESARQREAFRALAPALADRPFLLFLGRLHPKKGLEELLRGYAAARSGGGDWPDLVIAGPCRDESYRAALQGLAAELKATAVVHWLPMIEGDAKWGALRACAAFVLVSHQENFGLAVVEALACRRPVLISDQVNVWREIVADGAGFAAPDSVAGATQLLQRWANCARDEREQTARAARDCFARRFAIDTAVARLEAVVEETLADSTRAGTSTTLRSAP